MQILTQDIPDLSLNFIRDQHVYEDDTSDYDELKYMKGYVNVLKERFSRKYFNNDITATEALQRERDHQQLRNRSVSPTNTSARYRFQSNENIEPVVHNTTDIVRCSYTSEINANELPRANFVSSVKNIFENKSKVCCF